jgi:hypothetical protein
MKRPNKFTVNPDSYLTSDIDPLLDELQQLRNAEPFPTREEFEKWWDYAKPGEIIRKNIYSYFAQFKTRTIEVMPEVEKEYEFSSDGKEWNKEILICFEGYYGYYKHIRPIATPTRDEVLKKAKELGLTEAEIEVLGGKS